MEKTYVSTKLRCYSGIIRLYYQEEGIRKNWSLDEVKNVVHMWFCTEREVKFSVIVSNLETSFSYIEETIVEEPVVKVYGEIVRPDITDDKIKEQLLRLFSFLSSELKQKCQFYFQGYRENVYIRLF